MTNKDTGVCSTLSQWQPVVNVTLNVVLCLSTSRPAEDQNRLHCSTVIIVVQSYEKYISVKAWRDSLNNHNRTTLHCHITKSQQGTASAPSRRAAKFWLLSFRTTNISNNFSFIIKVHILSSVYEVIFFPALTTYSFHELRLPCPRLLGLLQFLSTWPAKSHH